MLGAALLRERGAGSSHASPRLGYDLAELGADKAGLEGAGLNFGGPGRAFGFVDTAYGQHREIQLRQ